MGLVYCPLGSLALALSCVLPHFLHLLALGGVCRITFHADLLVHKPCICFRKFSHDNTSLEYLVVFSLVYLLLDYAGVLAFHSYSHGNTGSENLL